MADMALVPLSDVEELAWQERALCAQTDPEVFFPNKGGSTLDARRVCKRCDVVAECLAYALRTNQQDGIWGGTSPVQRAKMRRAAA